MDGCQRHSFDAGAISRPSTARAPHSRHVLVRVSWSSDQEASMATSRAFVPIRKLVMLH